MLLKGTTSKGCELFIIIFSFLFLVSKANAELKLEFVSPTVGKLGVDLPVIMRGTGFNEDTKVIMGRDVGNRRAIMGSVSTPNWSWCVMVSDDFAYLGDGRYGEGHLLIFDITDPEDPQTVGRVSLPDVPTSVFLQDKRAYVTVDGEGLYVVDITDPIKPTVLGHVSSWSHAEEVFVVENIAYVAYDGAGLQIIDISDDENPHIIGSLDTGDTDAVTVVGDTAYVVVQGVGLKVIDVSEPKNPTILGTVIIPDIGAGNFGGVTVDRGMAYVSLQGFHIIEVTDPVSPRRISSLNMPTRYTHKVTVVGDTAYLANAAGGLQVINISTPESPKIIGAVDNDGDTQDVKVAEGKAYLASGGLQIIDVNKIKGSQIIGSLSFGGDNLSISGDKKRIFIGGNGFDFHIIDINDLQNPKSIGSVKNGATAGFDVVGDMVYLVGWKSALKIVDISNPGSPELIGSVDEDWSTVQDISVVGTIAYLAAGYSGLKVIDISTPENPRIIGSLPTSNARAVTIVGDTAYLADLERGLKVIDVSDPEKPRIIGTADTPDRAMDVKVVDDIAYVADLWDGGLQVIDVSDPNNPHVVGSVITPGNASAIEIVGHFAYMADHSHGIQVIDVEDPTSPYIVGNVSTPGYAYDLVISGNIAFVADSSLLTIVSIPVEIEPVQIIDQTSLSATLPAPSWAGDYNLDVFNESQRDELIGAVAFLSSEDYEILREKKAIIVAGYRSLTDTLWDKTQLSANMAYQSLMTQGYRGPDWDNIYYLSPEATDVDGDGEDDVDAVTNSENLSYAINTWAKGTNELLFYMTDHGGSGTFQLNENQILDANVLDDWLDELQPTVSERIIVVYDACKSGSFIPLLTPPAGKQRIVITSTTADEYAWFENDGVLSFSYQFWAYAMVNGYLSRAFNIAANMMETDQSALLDANGNGEPNEKEDDISDIVIGRGRVAAALPPFVGQVSGKQILTGETSASFWASNVGGLNPVVQVWAVIIPPGDRPADDPIINFPKVDLLDADQDGTYEATYDGFSSVGTYQVLVYAKDQDGAISLPKKIIVSQTDADSYEDDDMFSKANAIVLDDPNPQLHNFHDSGDEDWVKFYGLSGETYTIEAYKLGDNCDAVIEVYDTDGTTLLDDQDTIGDPNADESLDWLCAQDGIYYVKVKHYSAATFGDGSEYNLKVYRPFAPPLPGFVTGLVTDTLSGQEIADVKISTNANASALSLPDGNYVMIHPPGEYDLTAQKSGYNLKSILGIQVSKGGITPLNIALTPESSDSDNDGISDAVENASSCLDANDADTDNDGLLDGQEDTNYDGIFDSGETDPCDQDTDGDQMPDGWEVQYNLDPLVDDASEDADGDGYSNLQEYRGRSDPTDPLSLPDGGIAAGDFTGDGKADVASIWDSGLWYQDGATLAWAKIPGKAPKRLTAGDVTGDGRAEIIGTWRSGIWYWDVAASNWTRMTASIPTGDITAGDFTGDGKADVASIWNSGLWYQDGATLAWTKVGTAPGSLTAGDVTGDGRSEIIGTWSSGIWYWDVAASNWTRMTASTPTGDIAAGDFTGDGKADVASIWDSGLWYQDGATLAWTKVGTAPGSVTAGDVTGDDQAEVIGTWTNGIWCWDAAASNWIKMTSSIP